MDVESPIEGVSHRPPDLTEIVPDPGAFTVLHVFPVGHPLVFTVGHDGGQVGQVVDLLSLSGLFPFGAQGGAISVRSKHGEGTTFTVLLPLVDHTGPEEAGTAETEHLEGTAPGQGRILLVDDDADIVTINAESLENLGYKVACTSSSRAALALFMRAPGAFDLVVTDQTMPELTGDKLAEAIHAERPEMPIILCTGYAERIRHLRPGQFGIHTILLKPFGLGEFTRAVRDILEP